MDVQNKYHGFTGWFHWLLSLSTVWKSWLHSHHLFCFSINLTILPSISYHLQDQACPLSTRQKSAPLHCYFLTKSLSFPPLFLETLGNFSISGHSCQDNLFSWLIWFFLKKKSLQLFCIQLDVFLWDLFFPGSILDMVLLHFLYVQSLFLTWLALCLIWKLISFQTFFQTILYI